MNELSLAGARVETPLQTIIREARESMDAQLEIALRELHEGQRLAVGPITFAEGEGLKCEIRTLNRGDDLNDLEGERWTIYTAPPRLGFFYRNHREESSWRQVVAPRVFYGQTEFYPEDQWLLEAFDMDRMEMRVFAMKRMTHVGHEGQIG